MCVVDEIEANEYKHNKCYVIFWQSMKQGKCVYKIAHSREDNEEQETVEKKIIYLSNIWKPEEK